MSLIKGIFVQAPYAALIVDGHKTIETRSKNMLGKLVGRTVAIVETGRGKVPMVIGYVRIESARKETKETMDTLRDRTLVPKGSKYDTGSRWCYYLTGAYRFPHAVSLPQDAVRHGRSWCEWW